MRQRTRLAVVTTHPIQYYAPWFRYIAANSAIELKVFYLWNRGAEAKHDPGFGRKVQWDVPLLEGYDYEFVQNVAARPGSDRFWGIRNPEVKDRISEFGPDAALLIGYRHASMMRLILTPERRRGYPLILRGDSHRLAQPSESRKWKVEGRKFLISQIFRRFAAFLYVGKANKEYFRMHGAPEERLFFAPHAIDNERFMSSADAAADQARQWRRELGIGDDQLVVLFAGKFEDKKRPVDLLEAFAKVEGRKEKGERSSAALLFVGNGHLEQELRGRAADVPNVFFAPFQNQSFMPRTYAACDLFVLPSYGPEESWGLAVNEALCRARPVIVSSHVGCGPDLVEQDRNGLVFEAGNVEALAEALRDALSDRERLEKWGIRGREIVQNYDYAHATRGLRAALEPLKC